MQVEYCCCCCCLLLLSLARLVDAWGDSCPLVWVELLTMVKHLGILQGQCVFTLK